MSAASHYLVELARRVIEMWVRERKVYPAPEGEAWFFTEQAGVFVSLKVEGTLRGCIGTLFPASSCIVKEVIQNAISAASRDPRFAPLQASELSELTIVVDVLDAPEPIESVNHLDPKRYGVIASQGDRLGLLLPDIEGIKNGPQQLEAVRRKAGIQQHEPAQLQRFTVRRLK